MSDIDQRIITVDQIMAWHPCGNYPRERIESLFAGRGSVTPLEIARCEAVPAQDRLWLLLREPILSARQLRLLACDFATEALEQERAAGREPDPRSWACVAVSRRYADGEATGEELDAARDAAWDAASPARDAAWDADCAAWDAWDAACTAARAAAWDADCAAWDAACPARDAAWDAAWDAQLARVVGTLEANQ